MHGWIALRAVFLSTPYTPCQLLGSNMAIWKPTASSTDTAVIVASSSAMHQFQGPGPHHAAHAFDDLGSPTVMWSMLVA